MMKTTWLKKLLVGTASALALALALSSLPGGAAAATMPAPDKLTIFPNPNVVSSSGCPVIVKPSLSWSPSKTYPNEWVTFQGTGTLPLPGKTDANGVLKRTVANGSKIQAVLITQPGTLLSNVFTCGAKTPTP